MDRKMAVSKMTLKGNHVSVSVCMACVSQVVPCFYIDENGLGMRL